MNEEAKKFLQSKGYHPDESGKFIVSGDDGHDFDLAELLDEYVRARNTTPPVPPPPPKP